MKNRRGLKKAEMKWKKSKLLNADIIRKVLKWKLIKTIYNALFHNFFLLTPLVVAELIDEAIVVDAYSCLCSCRVPKKKVFFSFLIFFYYCFIFITKIIIIKSDEEVFCSYERILKWMEGSRNIFLCSSPFYHHAYGSLKKSE